MLLKGPTVQLVPYSSEHWRTMALWFYDTSYKDMWRHFPKAWGQAEFERYPQILNAEVFLVIQDAKPVGFVQIIPDSKTNRGFYLGILLDKTVHRSKLTPECFMLVMDYAFNRLGYRKAIVEIVASNTHLKQNLAKSGFLSEGTQYGEAFIDGVFVDEVRFSMSSDFFKKKYKQVVDSWVDC